MLELPYNVVGHWSKSGHSNFKGVAGAFTQATAPSADFLGLTATFLQQVVDQWDVVHHIVRGPHYRHQVRMPRMDHIEQLQHLDWSVFLRATAKLQTVMQDRAQAVLRAQQAQQRDAILMGQVLLQSGMQQYQLGQLLQQQANLIRDLQ